MELEIKDKTNADDDIKIAAFRKNIRKTSPHKHNKYLEIVYLTEGKGSHTIDTKKYDIATPIVFIIRKEQVHFWDIQSEPEGFVLIIKKQFIDNCLDEEIKRFISDLTSHTCLYPIDQSSSDIFTLLIKEHQQNKPSKQPIVEGLLKALLAKLLESAKPKYVRNVNNTIFQQYIALLNTEDQLSNSVAHYAKLLNTTPQNLNAHCRKESSQSATNVLAGFLMSEAKRLLLYTDLTVTEIAFRLDFKDNSHFTKYFKKHEGQTPIHFRSRSS